MRCTVQSDAPRDAPCMQLANALFMREGSLLLEVGFASPFASHYAHAAAALGLHYKVHACGYPERTLQCAYPVHAYCVPVHTPRSVPRGAAYGVRCTLTSQAARQLGRGR